MMGKRAITSLSRKQGMNTRGSTEVEIVATDEIISPMMRTQLFLKAQGYPVRKTSYTRTIKCYAPQDWWQECRQVLPSSQYPIHLHH